MTGYDQKACVCFHKLSVINIENSSGIFIGTNKAIGWANWSKSNEGFGSMKDATASRIISVVHDEDLTDASFRDAKWIAFQEQGSAAQQCAVDFQSVNVNSVANGSAVDLGDIKQLGWRTSRKNNYGGGKNYGSNRQSQIINVVFDDDRTDASFQFNQKVVDEALRSARNVRITHQNRDPRDEEAVGEGTDTEL